MYHPRGGGGGRQVVAESRRYGSQGRGAGSAWQQQTQLRERSPATNRFGSVTSLSMAQGVEEVFVAADAAELDLTNAHLRNLDDVPLPESLSV